MPEIDGCTVKLSHGQQIDGCRVLFKDNGWIRVRSDSNRFWYPPHRVDSVRKSDTGGEL
jgi:hypothetical protein